MAFALFTAPFAGSSLYGSKPVLPDIQTEYEKWLKLTNTELPALEGIASKVNKFNSDELMAQIRATTPGYDELMAKGEANISSMLSGEIPKDVQEQIQRTSAYKSFAGGFGEAGGNPSGAGSALEARNLGLTSLDLATKGLDASMRWMASSRNLTSTPLMDITHSFLPTDAFYKRQLQANLIEAAPDPVAVGRFNTEMGYLGMALSIFGGSGYKPQTPQNGSQYLNQGQQSENWGGGGGWNEGYNVNSGFNSDMGGGGTGTSTGMGGGDMGGGMGGYGDFGSVGFA